MKKINILGTRISQITSDEALETIKKFLEDKTKHFIVTPNPEMVILAQTDNKFREIINQADLAIADGIGLLWAAKYLSLQFKIYNSNILNFIQSFCYLIFSLLSLIFYPKYCQSILPERVTGVDFFIKITELCERKNCSIFLLGAGTGVAEACALKLVQRFPALKISGTFSGSPKKEDEKMIISIINQAKPNVLFVAFGHGKQELWIKRNLGKLETVKIAMGVGGAFDFISKTVRRAPKIFQKANLEWLWRLSRQPHRAKRIYTATFKFIKEVFKYKLQIQNVKTKKVR